MEKLDQAWEEINALGGTTSRDRYEDGINATVERALCIIERLGGMDPKRRLSVPERVKCSCGKPNNVTCYNPDCERPA